MWTWIKEVLSKIPRTAWLVAGGLVLLVIVLQLLWVQAPNWTGWGDQTLWNLLELLIIPAVLAVGAYWFNRQERATDREITDQRVEKDRDLAAERQREDALIGYLDAMTELMLEHGLRNWGKDGPQDDVELTYVAARNVARTRTLTVLRVLDDAPNPLMTLVLGATALVIYLKYAPNCSLLVHLVTLLAIIFVSPTNC